MATKKKKPKPPAPTARVVSGHVLDEWVVTVNKKKYQLLHEVFEGYLASDISDSTKVIHIRKGDL